VVSEESQIQGPLELHKDTLYQKSISNPQTNHRNKKQEIPFYFLVIWTAKVNPCYISCLK
jgi:hypothetical protein